MSGPPPVPVARPCFDEAEERAVLEVLRSGWVTQGPRVVEFESRFAAAVGAPEAVALSSCTAGLFLALHALGVKAGDEVIVPSLSFIASANAVVHAGASPVFVDVAPRSYNLDPEAVGAAIGPRTRAILLVHQLGLPADLELLAKLAADRAVELVEDIHRIEKEQKSIPRDILTLGQQITDANAAIFDPHHNFAGCIPGIHEILRRQGLLEGLWTLDPNERLSPGQLEEIDRICSAYPHLNDNEFVRQHLDDWLK